MVLPILFMTLIVVSVAEIAIIIQVSHAIGPLLTFALLIVEAALGSMLMRSQGRAVWRRFQQTLAARRVPGRELLDGVLVIAGGALLIAPGFLTDIVGALLLAPPSRSVVRRLLTRRFSRRLRVTRSYDVEGSAVEVERPDLTR